MAKSRQQKELNVQQLTEKFGQMKALVFSSFAGLSVKDATELRKTLRDEEVEYFVAKKSLLRRALEQSKLDPAIADQLEGGVSIAIGYSDEVLPAKLLATFAKTHESVELLGGLVDGTYVDAAQVTELSKLPSREELIAKTVWTIKAPLTGLVGVLSGNIRGLITVLSARKDKLPA